MYSPPKPQNAPRCSSTATLSASAPPLPPSTPLHHRDPRRPSALGVRLCSKLSLFQIVCSQGASQTLLSNYRFLRQRLSTCHLFSSLLHGKLQTRVLPYSPTLPQAVLPFTFGSSLFRNPALFFLTLFIHFSSTGAGLPFRAGCEGGNNILHTLIFNSIVGFSFRWYTHTAPSQSYDAGPASHIPLSRIYLCCFLQYTTGPLLGQYFYSGRG